MLSFTGPGAPQVAVFSTAWSTDARLDQTSEESAKYLKRVMGILRLTMTPLSCRRSGSANTQRVVPILAAGNSGVKERMVRSQGLPPPATTAMYCLPSTMKLRGNELGVSLSCASQSV